MSSSSRSLFAVDTPQVLTSDSRRGSESLLVLAEKLLDMAAVVMAVCLSAAMYRVLEPQRADTYSRSGLTLCSCGFALLFVFLLERHGGYRPYVSLLGIRETERILRVTVQCFAVAVVAAYISVSAVPRLALGLVAVSVPLLVTLEKWETHNVLRLLRSKGWGMRRALILGTGSAARRIYSSLVQSPKFGLEPVAFVEDSVPQTAAEIYECSYHRKHSAQVLPGPLCPELFRQFNVSVLIIADRILDRDSMLLTMAKASEAGAATYFASADFLEPGYWLTYEELDGIMLAHCSRESTRLVYDLGKRGLDFLVALLALLLCLPISGLLSLLIKITSGGPVLFRQDRIGKDGRLFAMYKFRSMYKNAAKYGYSPREDEDPRVTRVGRFLRRTSLDELPQLWNVLMGDMSLVGPRPEMPFIVEQYTALQRRRLTVKPGMTGLWQISADRGLSDSRKP